MANRRGFAAVAAGVGLLVGLALGGLLHVLSGEGEASAPSLSREPMAGSGEASVQQLAALGEALAAERAERIALAAEVARLRSELEELAPAAEASPPAETSEGAADAGAASPAPSEVAAAGQWFEDSALLERGVSPDEVARLHRRFEETEMEILYLRDRATREGWNRRRRMMTELADIRAGLREEVGDEAYDLILYATGQDNRVIITDVLATSPARAADLRPGDVIVRYGDRAIFSVSDLQRETRSGDAGAPVTVEVRRDDEELRTYIARGPLGVRLQSARREPATRW
jgi:hypothetical protein